MIVDFLLSYRMSANKHLLHACVPVCLKHSYVQFVGLCAPENCTESTHITDGSRTMPLLIRLVTAGNL